MVRTPLVALPRVGPRLVIKPESVQPTGAFKLRGAYAAISALPPAVAQRGVVAHSSGNHAQAVAYAAALLHGPAVEGIPDNAPHGKVEAKPAFRGEIRTSRPRMALK